MFSRVNHSNWLAYKDGKEFKLLPHTHIYKPSSTEIKFAHSIHQEVQESNGAKEPPDPGDKNVMEAYLLWMAVLKIRLVRR